MDKKIKIFQSHPDIARQWHPTKNGNLKPEQFTAGSGKKIWWLCKNKCKEGCNHEWDATIYDRTSGGGCPFCSPSRFKLCIHDSIVYSHPDVAKQWHPTKNSELQPEHYGFGSHTKVWWLCENTCNEGCKHEWDSVISSRCNGVGCPFCSRPQKKNCIHDSIIYTHPDIAKQWHPTKNNKYKIENITYGNGKNVSWKCDKEQCHEWECIIQNRTKGNGCPYCANQELCKNEDCVSCKSKSFAISHKAIYWSDKNKSKPYEVYISAKKEYLFNCIVCNHEFSASLNNISTGHWCPYCAHLKLCKTDCSFCLNNSFESSNKVQYWTYDKNEGINPRDIQKFTEKPYWFKCIKGHEFKKRIDLITRCNGWCPYCVNKTEQKLFDILITKYTTLQQQFKVEWCKNKTYLPFDFVIEDYKIIIELDGRQHFEQISNWSSPLATQANDKFKMKCANSNEYSIIRLLQEDVFYDVYDWLNELIINIEKIKNDKCIKNIFMCKNNEYEVFNSLDTNIKSVLNIIDTNIKLDFINLEVLEYNNKDYYLDSRNNNTYEITIDKDIGDFIGVYNKNDNKIIN